MCQEENAVTNTNRFMMIVNGGSIYAVYNDMNFIGANNDFLITFNVFVKKISF